MTGGGANKSGGNEQDILLKEGDEEEEDAEAGDDSFEVSHCVHAFCFIRDTLKNEIRNLPKSSLYTGPGKTDFARLTSATHCC